MAIFSGNLIFKTAVHLQCQVFIIPWAKNKVGTIRCSKGRDYSNSFPLRYIPRKSSKSEQTEAVSLPEDSKISTRKQDSLELNVQRVEGSDNAETSWSRVSEAYTRKQNSLESNVQRVEFSDDAQTSLSPGSEASSPLKDRKIYTRKQDSLDSNLHRVEFSDNVQTPLSCGSEAHSHLNDSKTYERKQNRLDTNVHGVEFSDNVQTRWSRGSEAPSSLNDCKIYTRKQNSLDSNVEEVEVSDSTQTSCRRGPEGSPRNNRKIYSQKQNSLDSNVSRVEFSDNAQTSWSQGSEAPSLKDCKILIEKQNTLDSKVQRIEFPNNVYTSRSRGSEGPFNDRKVYPRKQDSLDSNTQRVEVANNAQTSSNRGSFLSKVNFRVRPDDNINVDVGLGTGEIEFDGNMLSEKEPEEVIEELDGSSGEERNESHGIQGGRIKQDVEKLAIGLLATRAFTAVQLKKKLLGKKFPQFIVDAVIKDFQGRGLIDDFLYAETYSRSRWSSSTWGPRRIKKALFGKGVSQDDADKAVKLVFSDAEATDSQESSFGMSKRSLDHLFAQASKQWLRSHDVSTDTRKSRIVRWLQYRGFNWSIINTVLKKLESDYPP